MTRINEITAGMTVEGAFAVKDMALRETRKGSRYIRLVLSDATGSLVANLWDASEDAYPSLAGAEVVMVRGTAETYQNALQLNLNRVRPAEPHEFDLAALLAESPHDRAALLEELVRLVEELADEDYKGLIHLFLDDREWLDRFQRAPAARAFHHAYVGGLLEHTLAVMRLADRCASLNPVLRRELLLAGAFFHDIGKIEELRLGAAIEYTDEGSLLGHLSQGALAVEARLTVLPEFPREKRNLLLHLILSHHGRYEYGSPVLPATPEAIALHHLDNLDAKVFAAGKAIEDDPDPARNWTERSFMLETRLFKG
ncbi:MAG: HD domain-containing protein [Planctomycetota bacterium]